MVLAASPAAFEIAAAEVAVGLYVADHSPEMKMRRGSGAS
jgi:hypothetical protein